MIETLTVLGLESSCDDTAAAVVSHHPGEPARVRSSIVHGQDDLHLEFGGIVPEVAARAHATRLDHAAEEALAEAGQTLADMDAIAVTAGPGLIGGLIAGIAFADGLATGSGKPLIAINHLAAHALTVRMTDAVGFPYLALLASGGHCQFLAVHGPDSFVRLGGTIDDAPGEAFDKSARILGLGQPGGPAIEQAAKSGDPRRFRLPRPLSGRQGCNMSFSGLKTSLLRTFDGLQSSGQPPFATVSDLCAGFQQAVVEVLAEKTRTALEMFAERFAEPRALAICGGVAANIRIRDALEELCAECRISFHAPPLRYCTDNGAMVAWTAIELLREGLVTGDTFSARPRWPLDKASTPLLGSGRKGPKS